MKIAIDGRSLTWVDSGFKTYALGVIGGLIRIDHKNEYIIYLDRHLENPTWTKGVNFHEIVLRKGLTGFAWKQIKLPFDAMMNRRKPDIFHFLCNSPAYTCPGELVYTIHDLSFKHVPGMIPKHHALSLKIQMPIGAKLARKIITDSNSAKEDICHYFGTNPEKVAVIPGGVDEAFKPIGDQKKLDLIKKRYNLTDNFILYLGSFLPHKNLSTLLHAYRQLPDCIRESFTLVLAGYQGWNFDVVRRLIYELSLNDQVITPGRIPFEDLPALYSLASLFVFPSLYEGFGLPILEAMACGTPVIASNVSSIPEVVGDAGVLASPTEVEAWIDVITKVLLSQSEVTKMRLKGLERAKLFNWNEAARKTLAVYEELM